MQLNYLINSTILKKESLSKSLFFCKNYCCNGLYLLIFEAVMTKNHESIRLKV